MLRRSGSARCVCVSLLLCVGRHDPMVRWCVFSDRSVRPTPRLILVHGWVRRRGYSSHANGRSSTAARMIVEITPSGLPSRLSGRSKPASQPANRPLPDGAPVQTAAYYTVVGAERPSVWPSS